MPTEYVYNEFSRRWTVGGSSNGLVCMYESSNSDKPIHVINPYQWDMCLGFGYDSSNDDYKVVIVMNNDRDRKALVHILNLKSNIWKPLGHFNYWFNYTEQATPGILYNEALHWFWSDANDTTNEKVLIVSFDLAKEEFREIPQPDDPRYVLGRHSTLGIIEGCLCIFTIMLYRINNPLIHVWVIKDYNVKPSWELLPITYPSEMKDHAIHYMHQNDHAIPYHPYYCDDNIQLSKDVKHIRSPIFVQTLVSPYVNNNRRRSDPKKSKRIVKSASGKGRREIEEVYTMKDGKKNAYNKRKRKRSGSRN